MKRVLFLLFSFILLAVVSCDTESEKVYPPEKVVNRVTDFYMFDDGKTFIYLNSNMNRRYDFGELVLMQIDDDGDIVFQDSLLVPSITGKMAVTSDEKFIFVTTRDKNGVVKAEIVGKSGSYKLQYQDGTKGDYPEILKTKKEPYAQVLSSDNSKLLVSHILNGELSVVDVEEWKVIKTAKLKYGVTELIYDENTNYYLASHKTSGKISLIEAKETLDDFVVSVKELTIELPTDGYDVRSIKQSKTAEGSVFYAAYQNTFNENSYNYTYDEDTAPQVVTLKLENNSLEVLDTLAVGGNLGELTVFPYSSGDEDGERKGDLIFLSLPSEEKLEIINSTEGAVRVREIVSYRDDEKECKPYQLYSKSTGDTTGYLFVSCFQNDMFYLYKIDLTAEQILQQIGVLR